MKNQEAYDALGKVQRYYQNHEVSAGMLWMDKWKVRLDRPNGEAAACIWGAMIATGYRTVGDYAARRLPKVLDAALLAANPDPDGAHPFDSIISINDDIVRRDKKRMRRWLRDARRILKAKT